MSLTGRSETNDHGTSPPPQPRAGARHQRRLLWSFLLILVFFGAEAAVGLITNSLAVLSDAGHMLVDVLGLGMALAAVHFAGRAGVDRQRTYGMYRLEILAALANAALLLGVAVYLLYEAVSRLSEPPEIPGIPLLVVGVAGLAVNLTMMYLLGRGSRDSLNIEGAYLEVLADALGSVGVIVAAVVLETTGWQFVDPIVGAVVGLVVLPRAVRLGMGAVRILIEAAPPHIDPEAVRASLQRLSDVVDVHDLHIWTLTSDMEVASVHLTVGGDADPHAVLDQARDVLRIDYDITHATLQVEPEDHRDCVETSW
ncbi:MAG: cation diffusion facilitator family transporter [Acidimicrobiia bacterium]